MVGKKGYLAVRAGGLLSGSWAHNRKKISMPYHN